MPEAKTVAAKYVFLDIVGYTHNRSVDAQSDIVESLNAIVKGALSSKGVDERDLILLPTGDGMCISLLNVDVPGIPYDLHLQLALEILRLLHEYNERTSNAMRKFEVRIGINANVDNLVMDINGRQNVAGAGISNAQRVMSEADGNQILVGEMVHETLKQRDKYLEAFNPFVATSKHGLNLPVYQYKFPSPGLDVSVPSHFRPILEAQRDESKLPREVAAYLAQANMYRNEILGYVQDSTAGPALKVLLYLLALDSLAIMASTKTNPSSLGTWGVETADIHQYNDRYTWRTPKATFQDQFKYYQGQDRSMRLQLAEHIDDLLEEHSDLFEESQRLGRHYFVNSSGHKRIRKEHPDIYKAWVEGK